MSTARLAGATRYGTAAAIAGDTTFASPTTVIVATGENFPDALAASTLAGSSAPAPIILTQTGTYTQEAKSGLAALKSKGVSTVTIVGGTAAVSDTVLNAIKADGFTVTRVAGADRYATAAAIATTANSKAATGSVGGLKTALIATAFNFPDALAGGPAAYRSKLPLLLVNVNDIPQATKDALSSLGIKQAIILGGTAAVSDAVKGQLDTLTGNPSVRLAGTNRFGTAAAIGDYEITTLGFGGTSAVLATGNNFPDALAAGPLGGANGAPIVLTASLPAESQDWLDRHSNTVGKLFVSGGTSAVSDADVSAAQAAAQNTANDTGTNKTATTRPELVSAAIVSTVSTLSGTLTNPQGTTVAFTFDEPVQGASPDVTKYHLYRYSTPNTQINPTTTNGVTAVATVSSTDPKTINVLFPQLTTTDTNTTTGTGGITVATVDLAAATGNGAATNAPDTNPEGAAALTGAAAAAPTSGTTSAPDLISVGGFRTPQTGTTSDRLVDFTFDQAAWVQTSFGTTGFHLVMLDGNESPSCTTPLPTDTSGTAPSGGNVPGGNGTTTITVRCAVPTAGTYNGQPVSSSNIARAYVNAGAVGTQQASGGTVNPLEATTSPHNPSTNPDLVSVTFTAGNGTTTTVDTAVFTFDEAVNAPTEARLFHVYQADGTQLNGSNSTSSPLRNSSNPAQVSVSFPLGSLATAVGGSVDSATSSTGRAVNGNTVSSVSTSFTNAADSVPATPASGSTATAGKTAAPDLTGAIISITNNAFGQPTSVSVVYVFDSNITSGVTSSKFFLHLSDGSRMVCGLVLTTAASSTIPANAAVCSSSAGGYTYVGGQAGSHSGAATLAEMGSGVLATIDNGAAVDASGNQSPEGAAVTGGGTGTPAS